MSNQGFDCTNIYMSHDDEITCIICGLKMCKKCNLHYFWKSNNKDTRLLYCPNHLNQKFGNVGFDLQFKGITVQIKCE